LSASGTFPQYCVPVRITASDAHIKNTKLSLGYCIYLEKTEEITVDGQVDIISILPPQIISNTIPPSWLGSGGREYLEKRAFSNALSRDGMLVSILLDMKDSLKEVMDTIYKTVSAPSSLG
jgi:hypothetical protein